MLPGWSRLAVGDVDFDEPKGFSSFTMGVRPRLPVEPPAVLYRHLEGKENAILDFEAERSVFLLLGSAGIAAECLHYDDRCRIEAFHRGRSLTAGDLSSPEVLTGIADTIEKRVDRMLTILLRLMEPALLLGMAGVVLFIFVALIVPMLKMSAAI